MRHFQASNLNSKYVYVKMCIGANGSVDLLVLILQTRFNNSNAHILFQSLFQLHKHRIISLIREKRAALTTTTAATTI